MESDSRQNRPGRSHSHAVKVGNGRRRGKKAKKLVYVRGVLLNGQAYAYVGP